MALTAILQSLGGPRMMFIGAIVAVVILVCARAIRLGSRETHKRGAVLAESGQRRRPARRSARAHAGGGLTLAGCDVPYHDETKHFKMIGTTGTGKSTAIRELLATALARGDRAVIADPDGGYLANFYNAERGDVILNPFEDDAAKWNLFGEITNDYDVDQLARSLIPDSG